MQIFPPHCSMPLTPPKRLNGLMFVSSRLWAHTTYYGRTAALITEWFFYKPKEQAKNDLLELGVGRFGNSLDQY